MSNIIYKQTVTLKQFNPDKVYSGDSFKEALDCLRSGDHVYSKTHLNRYKRAVYVRLGLIWKSLLAITGQVSDWQFCQDLFERDVVDEFSVHISYQRKVEKTQVV